MAIEDDRIDDDLINDDLINDDLINDDLIDAVARGMTSGQPSDMLRVTVLRRVSTPDGWGTGLRPWTVAAAASVLVVVALVVAVVRLRPDRVMSSGSGPARQIARVTPPVGQPRTPERASETPTAAGDGAAPGQRTTARQTLANDAGDDPDSGDTVGIAPLVVTPLAIALLEPAAVDIEAVPAPATVVIGEIDVAPLRLDAMQDGLVE